MTLASQMVSVGYAYKHSCRKLDYLSAVLIILRQVFMVTSLIFFIRPFQYGL